MVSEMEAQPADKAGADRNAREVLSALDWQLVPPLAVALIIGIGTVAAVPLLARPFALLLIAITLAQALGPLVSLLERWLRRDLAIVVVYGLLFGLVGVCGWAVVPPLIVQGRELVDRLPAMLDSVRHLAARFGPVSHGRFDQLVASLTSRAGNFLVGLPVTLFSSLVDVFLVIFLSVYWLVGARALMRFTLSLVPGGRQAGARRVLQHMGRAMGGYVRGTFINAVIMGALAFAGLSLIHIPFALVLGVLTMLGEMVPIVGPVVVGAVVVTVGLVQSLTSALLAAALYTGLIQLEGHLLTPNIMHRETHVPQTLVLFAIVVGGALGGLVGIIVSIPMAAALRVLVIEVLAPAERRWSGIDAGRGTRNGKADPVGPLPDDAA